jgi:hypothetical protein
MAESSPGPVTAVRPAKRAAKPARRQSRIPAAEKSARQNTATGALPSHAGLIAIDPQGWPDRSSLPHGLRLQRKLAVGSVSDPLEMEADRIADSIVREGSRAIAHGRSPLAVQRMCSCEEHGTPCAACAAKQADEKEEALQRKAGPNAPQMHAPPLVHDVLRTPGQPLDAATRAFVEPRFGRDFSNVRVHTDARAAESAHMVEARAYTVGSHLVFASGEYRPQTSHGRHLLAHELAHVLQQGKAGRTLRRQAAATYDGSSSIFREAYAKADEARWEEVAALINGLSPAQMNQFLYTFKDDPEKISYIYLGAIGNKGVGPDSQVAIATRYTHLDFNYKKQMRLGNFGWAGEYLNGFNKTDVIRRLNHLSTETIRILHNDAVEKPELGPDSGTAKFTAEVLQQRAAKGDVAAAAPLAGTKEAAKLTGEQKKARCQAGAPDNEMIFPLRLPRGLWRIDVAPITARRDGDSILVSQPVNAVFGNSYFHNEVRTLPVQVFTGGIRLKPDDVVRVRLYDDNNKIVCVTGEQMLKIGEATDTATLVGIIDTALLAAIVFAPAAGAGRAAVTRLAVTGIAAHELGEVAIEGKLVDAGIQDQIDWAGIVFDTIFQLVTLRFGSVLSEAGVTRLLGTEAAQFGRPALKFAVEAAMSGTIAGFQSVARLVFDKLRGKAQPMTYAQFIEELAKQFAIGVLFHTVSAAAQEHGGVPSGGKGGSKPRDVVADTTDVDTQPDVESRTGKPQNAPRARTKGAPTEPSAVTQTRQRTRRASTPPDQETNVPGSKAPAKAPKSVDEIPWADDVGMAAIELNRAGAYQEFNRWIAHDPLREVGIYRDPASGEFIVVQGKETSVGLKDVFSDASMRRNWEPIEHYHPGADPLARIASGGDFHAMMHGQITGQSPVGPVSSRIRWLDPQTGAGRVTEIGFRPGDAEPYYMKFQELDGKPVEKTFKTEPWLPGSDYEKFLESRYAAAGTPASGTGSPQPGSARVTHIDFSDEEGTVIEAGPEQNAPKRKPKPSPRSGTPTNPLRNVPAREIDRAVNQIGPAGDPQLLFPWRQRSAAKRQLANDPQLLYGFGQTGKPKPGRVEAAHAAPRSAMRGVPGYDPKEAFTNFLQHDPHYSMDAGWKSEFQAMQARGQSTAPAGEVFEIIKKSIQSSKGLTQSAKDSEIARLQVEMFIELGLDPSDVIPLPYPR